MLVEVKRKPLSPYGKSCNKTSFERSKYPNGCIKSKTSARRHQHSASKAYQYHRMVWNKMATQKPKGLIRAGFNGGVRGGKTIQLA